eukprot:1458526-Pleurochrysis_carterae.AAC.2
MKQEAFAHERTVEAMRGEVRTPSQAQHSHTRTRTDAQTHTLTHARTHAHTHTHGSGTGRVARRGCSAHIGDRAGIAWWPQRVPRCMLALSQARTSSMYTRPTTGYRTRRGLRGRNHTGPCACAQTCDCDLASESKLCTRRSTSV